MDMAQELGVMTKDVNIKTSWDCIVITASSKNQAKAFEKQIEYAKSIKLVGDTDFLVVADKGDKRVGSGGSTLSVIRELKNKYHDFSNKRFLVIHAGGDSKRCPQYSAIGKLFSPIPYEINNRPATLFDLLLKYVSVLGNKLKEGMLLLSGDVILIFDGHNIEISNYDACAISFKENVNTAKNHGVYLENSDGYVQNFLHKQSVDTLNNLGAVDINNECNIDTGAIYLNVGILNKLYELVEDDNDYEMMVNDTVRLSLYGDIEYCLASGSSIDDYYLQAPEGQFCEELKKAREILWNKISPYKMKLISLNGKFVHFGSIKEIMQLMSIGIHKYKVLGWNKNICSLTYGKDVGAYNSIVSDDCVVGDNVYLENAYVCDGAHIGNNCYISSIEITDVAIADNLLVHCLKQNDGKYICRIMSVDDNPKENKIFGRDIDELIDEYQLNDVFDDDSHSLWNAKLYIEADTMTEALNHSLYLYDLLNGNCDNRLFNESRRKSLCSGFNEADILSIIDYNRGLSDLVVVNKIDGLITANEPVVKTKDIVIDDSLSDIQIKWLNEKINKLDVNKLEDFSYAMRLYYYLGYAFNDEEYINRCFKHISNVIVNTTLNNLEYNDACSIKHDNTIVRLPLRVNFGGGWSDTPPHCMECGGTVINAAIDLNDELPVEVSLSKLKENKIVFKSEDMNTYGEFDSLDKLQKVGDPLDPYALQKACLLACGIIPKAGGDFNEIINRLSGGFILCSKASNVPTGSGLGTSSILSAACVKAVFEFMDIEYDENKLCSTVLAMEQIMSTGGGWQDQIGGISSGIKFVTSKPGINQDIKIEHLALSEKLKKEFNDRFMIIYSGQQRLAKNLLRDVVGRYVGNVEESIRAHKDIQEVAIKMKDALLADDFEEFAKLLDYHWSLSKKIDAGSSNPHIERIFNCINDYIDARMVVGAGGGGFLQIIAKRGVNRSDIQRKIDETFNNPSIKVYESKIVY